jgi:phospholipid/cholesterol/gamma-HCH transport system substrate-binding protein
MNPSRLELLVGLFVLAGLAAMTWLTLKVGAGSFLPGPSYVVEARFSNTGGLNVGSSVRVAGVTVGTVESLRIDPVNYGAIATLRLSQELKLPTDTMASIKTTGLIGDKHIALSPGADETHLRSGAQITMTESSVDLESLISRVVFGSATPRTGESGGVPATPQARGP